MKLVFIYLCSIILIQVTSTIDVRHYGNPANGCLDDEITGDLGDAGVACLPQCQGNNQCPTDYPPGTTATGICAIRDPNLGSSYCVLVCNGPVVGQCPPESASSQGRLGMFSPR